MCKLSHVSAQPGLNPNDPAIGPTVKEGVSKGHPSFFSLCSFLLLAQKKRTKEKGTGKDNLSLFWAPAAQALKAPPKRLRFAPFPDCLRASKDLDC
jgi:hypothetical protein